MNAKPKSFSENEKQDSQPGTEQEMSPRPEYINPNYKAAGKLTNKTALITGGDSGIGRAVAIHFAMEGADIAVAYLDESQDARETKRLVEQAGRKCILLRGDIRKKEFCDKIVNQTISKLGTLNILVNNAAQQFPQDDFLKISKGQLEKTFNVNILPYFFLSQAAVKNMKDGDCIINTSSVTAYRGSPHLIDYSSTKGAIVSFTRSLSENLAPQKIRVNSVAPGPVWTPLIVSSFDKEEIKQFGKKVPMGRAGQPSEIAPAYVFLASEDASYITGQVIHVNGGELING
ncbi:SDR family oxidoreductase [Daejeonella lutea]|uniref:NAD(P)-dependent dehydrogenase, short-chain alcohol dehydrogenase family n=1 Tax=Daejeonella lutea TaxID=572036 RepID=A0A1T5B6R2_9SPHI|nr:SDR family oxidoreductase [Daejeonella lutea]SKB42958.1 NAD(P)-dependent dehydrogenase, short-chain alcohol dehydrogenase family [Daejeonella lutea]